MYTMLKRYYTTVILFESNLILHSMRNYHSVCKFRANSRSMRSCHFTCNFSFYGLYANFILSFMHTSSFYVWLFYVQFFILRAILHSNFILRILCKKIFILQSLYQNLYIISPFPPSHYPLSLLIITNKQNTNLYISLWRIISKVFRKCTYFLC